MGLRFIKGDITKVSADAIVNAANNTLLGGGGVDGAIHEAAGPELLAECITLGGCVTGDAKITKGYKLPSKYVIHTVGPIWRGGRFGEEILLRSCYRKSLELAVGNGCKSVAFPMISTGAYGYPRDLAFTASTNEISKFLAENPMDVIIVIHGEEDEHIHDDVFDTIDESIYALKGRELRRGRGRGRRGYEDDDFGAALHEDGALPECDEISVCLAKPPKESAPRKTNFTMHTDKENPFSNQKFEIDESFSEMVKRKMTEKGYKRTEVYVRADVTRFVFSKALSDRLYRPKMTTAIAIGIGLELEIDEFEELLRKAGFALSPSSSRDVIVRAFVENSIFDMARLNYVLCTNDLPLITEP